MVLSLSPPSGACSRSTFAHNLSGVQAWGLSCADAATPDACAEACCAKRGCTAWQWNPAWSHGGTLNCTRDGHGTHGACWVGSVGSRVDRAPGWIGGTSTAPPGHGNVWARTLFSGETALIFVNAGPTEAEISCDDKCIQAAGLTPGRTYRVRDLFGRRQLQPIALSAAGLSWSVPGDGGSVLVKLTAAV